MKLFMENSDWVTVNPHKFIALHTYKNSQWTTTDHVMSEKIKQESI